MCLITQSRLTLCDPMNSSPPGSFVHGILQARILEWVATSFSKVYNIVFKVYTPFIVFIKYWLYPLC